MVTVRETSLSPAELWRGWYDRLREASYYRLIDEVYRGKVAKRSGLPYINHVREGVYVYARLFGWEERAVAAYCVHPIFQSDRSLAKVVRGEIDVGGLGREDVVLAMEYRRVANAYVSTMKVRPAEGIGLSPLDEVNRMLVADKVQNKKDFVGRVLGRVDRPSYRRAGRRYVAYFDSWLARLGVSEEVYGKVTRELGEVFGSVD